jgi:hypothetical protein
MPNAASPEVEGGAGAPQGTVTLESSYVKGQLDDALALSRYAVSTGVQLPSGEPIPLDDVDLVQRIAVKLGALAADDTRVPSSGAGILADEWISFERAYYRLAVLTSPVTAETLEATRATRLVPGEPHNLRNRLLGYSPALRFTNLFALAAICIAVFVIAGECLVYVWGQEADTSLHLWQRNLVQTLLPWAYGALGSCAYLLRSAHYFIYQRCFDLRRKPEYFNRVLLGAISGGAIILFVDYLVDEDGGTVLHLSSAALGFIAGYSTDFLFNTIERIVAAIFPKTDIDPHTRPGRGRRLPEPRSNPPGGNRPPGGGTAHGNDGNEPQGAEPQGKSRGSTRGGAHSQSTVQPTTGA